MQSQISMRDEFIDELIRVAQNDERIVTVDCDVGSATRLWNFNLVYPERFYEAGIAEQNAFGIAAGLATCGLIPFVASFATFVSMRACEIVRTSISYPKNNVKIIGGYAGLSNGKDGATHQSIEDLAIMRAIPNMKVMCVSDPVIARNMISTLLEYHGPAYIRMQYESCPKVYADDYRLEIGKAGVLRNGSDITIVTLGTELFRALEAADRLAAEGIDAEVIDALWLKPLDTQTIGKSVKKTGRVITLEEHNIYGGLGDAVCRMLVDSGISAAFSGLGIKDLFTESGITTELRQKYDISADSVVREAKRLVSSTK